MAGSTLINDNAALFRIHAYLSIWAVFRGCTLEIYIMDSVRVKIFMLARAMW